MNIMTWVLFGLILGLLAFFLEKNHSMEELIGISLLGICGALIAVVFASVVFGTNIMGFNMSSIFIAFMGSFSLLLMGKSLRST